MSHHTPATVRDAWSGYISADDYDAHMSRNGQAEANARLVTSLLARYPPPGKRLLVAGAGTGQWLELAGPALAEYRMTCTDINRAFLVRVRERAARVGLEVETIADDLEDTRLPEAFDAAVVVLVFEHIDWRRGVASLARLGVERCFVVIQENPAGQESLVTPHREPIGTMRAFTAVHPRLVPREPLAAAFSVGGYSLAGEDAVDVPDGKRMVGAVFQRLR